MAALDSFITLNPARLVAKGSTGLYYDVVLDEATGAIKVELGSAVDIGDVTLLAGTAIVGKVGIDQTTDGTTNAVRLLAETTKVIGTINLSAAQTLATVTTVGTVTTVTTVAAVTAITNALPAGSNLIGRAAADASAATGGIPSTARLLSAAGTSGDTTNVKASAGRVYAIQGVNVNAAARYLKLYNSASAPIAGSGTPVKTLYLPPNMAFVFDWPLGLTFATGIGFTLVTGSADNSSTSVTAGDILALNVDYA